MQQPNQTRPITEADQPFNLFLYGTTRTRELDRTTLTEEERNAFVRQQFEAQHQHYTNHFPNADFHLIEKNAKPIGRIYIDRRPAEIGLMDIALLPEFQGQGIGGIFMDMLKSEAKDAGLPIVLHVEINNPDAYRFYERHGFLPIEDQQTHVKMSWTPPPS